VATNTDRITEVERNTIVLQTEVIYLKQSLNDANILNREAESKLTEVRQEVAVLKQRLDEQTKRVEMWSNRLWGLISILIGAILALSSGLIVTLARK